MGTKWHLGTLRNWRSSEPPRPSWLRAWCDLWMSFTLFGHFASSIVKESNCMLFFTADTWRDQSRFRRPGVFPGGGGNPVIFFGGDIPLKFSGYVHFPSLPVKLIQRLRLPHNTHAAGDWLNILTWPKITVWHYHLEICMSGRGSDSHMRPNRQWKYGGNHILCLPMYFPKP